MFEIRLDTELEDHLTRIAKKTGRTKTFYAREAIEACVRDMEDYYLAVDASRDAPIQRKKLSVSWVYQIKERALKQLKKLDKTAAARIIRFLNERIAGDQDPRRFGKELKGELKGIWRYRISEYRILCDIQENVCIVIVVRNDRRKSVYD